jgi:predicted aspartyl protease
MDHNDDEITITLVDALTGRSESIPVPASSTTFPMVLELAQAMLFEDANGSSDEWQVIKDSRVLWRSSSPAAATIRQAGINHGDLLVIARSKSTSSAPALDFSSLSAGRSAPATSGGLDFSGLRPAPAAAAGPSSIVYYPNMNLSEAVEYNPRPENLVELLQTKDHLQKELNYHQPALAKQIREALAVSKEAAVQVWRNEMIRGSISSAMKQTQKYLVEQQMQQRLAQNPTDTEAVAYFAKQQNQALITEQYHQMMQEYPESMGKILMLYIDVKINGHSIQAFCDSGAEATIMSYNVARDCGIDHLIDTRFAGMAVGVGTSKILGRIHVVQLQVGENYFFPISLTIMESPPKQPLIDGNPPPVVAKDMPFLLGLNMMKRHMCCIDLQEGCLKFRLGAVGHEFLSVPFLHEKDLSLEQGGTKGFNVDAANQEYLDHVQRQEEGGDDSDSMVDQENSGDGTSRGQEKK